MRHASSIETSSVDRESCFATGCNRARLEDVPEPTLAPNGGAAFRAGGSNHIPFIGLREGVFFHEFVE